MKPLMFCLPSSRAFAEALACRLDGEIGASEVRRFPDGESYLRVTEDIDGREVVLVASLDHPDQKVLSLIYLSELVREFGASRVGLVAPYLAYLRQDKRFNPGEAVTSTYFGELMSGYVDWLVTVDPHLHRLDSLDEVYSIPSRVVESAPAIAEWIRSEVERPVFIGPDAESEQWVSVVAAEADAPFVVLEKVRRGDRSVELTVPHLDQWTEHTPVLVDDIISTGGTMMETVRHLTELGMRRPTCIGVHGIFVADARADLLEAGAQRVVTTNTISHATNGIDVSGRVAAGVRELLDT